MDSAPEEAVRVALDEVAQQRLGVTEQFFQVHKLRDQDGLDPVVGVERGKNYWRVYLHIQDEPYFWVVGVRERAEGLTAEWGYASGRARVYLSIASRDLSIEEITSIAGLEPTRVCRKGEPHRILGKGLYPETHFYYEPALPDFTPFDTRLDNLLTTLRPHASGIASLAEQCTIGIQVTFNGYRDGNNGLHLDLAAIAAMTELKATFDYEVHLYGPELPDPDC